MGHVDEGDECDVGDAGDAGDAGDDGHAVNLNVSVVFSAQAGVVDASTLTLPAGATVADALAASGLALRHPALVLDQLPVGVWGVLCEPHTRLREADRVELYRPLSVDPKEARRRRQGSQRSLTGQRKVAAQRAQPSRAKLG